MYVLYWYDIVLERLYISILVSLCFFMFFFFALVFSLVVH